MKLLASFLRVTATTTAALLVMGAATYLSLSWYGSHRRAQATERFTSEHGALDTGAYVLPSPPDAANPARWLVEAGARLTWSRRDARLVGEAAVTPVEQWSPFQASAVQAAASSNLDALTTARHAVGLADSSYGVDSSLGLWTPTPPVFPLVGLGRLLAASARYSLGAGRLGSGLQDLETLSALSSSLEGEVAVGLQTGGWTCETLLLGVVADRLQRPELPEAELASLGALIPGADLTAGLDRYYAWRTAAAVGALDNPSGPQRLDHPRPPSGTAWERIVWRMTHDLGVAREIEAHEALLRGRRAGSEDTLAGGPEPVPGADVRTRAVLSSRVLIALGLAHRRQGLPHPADQAEPDSPEILPLTGEPPVIEAGPDGSLTLRASGTAAIVDPVFTSPVAPPPPLALRFPPPR